MISRPQSVPKCQRNAAPSFGMATAAATEAPKTVLVVVPPSPTVVPAGPKGKWTVVNKTVNVNINVNTMAVNGNRKQIQTTQMKQRVDACPAITTCGIVVGKETVVPKNKKKCFFDLAAGNVKNKSCGKKRSGRLVSPKTTRFSKYLMHALADQNLHAREESFIKGECKSEKEEEMLDCKSESDCGENEHVLGEDKLSRSSSISEFTKDWVSEEGENVDEDQDTRILELEEAITRTAERCALLQKKINATNRANDILRRTTQASGRV